MSDFNKRVNNLSPNKQALLALRLDSQKESFTAQANQYRGKRLVAYVVPQAGHRPTLNQLQDFLKPHLPDYMLPSAFIMLESLPLTPNGKVNRQALKPAQAVAPVTDDNYVAPQTDLEEELVRIWQAVLRIERIGTRDNFFDLGGHSLLATQLLSRIYESFLVELPLRTIFETPTIDGLATIIVQKQLEQSSSEELAELLSQFEDGPVDGPSNDLAS